MNRILVAPILGDDLVAVTINGVTTRLTPEQVMMLSASLDSAMEELDTFKSEYSEYLDDCWSRIGLE